VLFLFRNKRNGSEYLDTYEEVNTPEDRDTWDGWFYEEAKEPKELNKYLEISYSDANGNVTKRKVRVSKFDENWHGGTIFGHCELRKQNRTFRFDRITSCVDLETGEIIDNVKNYIISCYKSSPEYSCERIWNNSYEYLKALIYVCKADGQYRKAEKILVRDEIRSIANDDRITDKMVDNMMSYVDIPTLHSFKIAVGRVEKSKELRSRLYPISERIVKTQKNVTAVEQEALDYIEKKIKPLTTA